MTLEGHCSKRKLLRADRVSSGDCAATRLLLYQLRPSTTHILAVLVAAWSLAAAEPTNAAREETAPCSGHIKVVYNVVSEDECWGLCLASGACSAWSLSPSPWTAQWASVLPSPPPPPPPPPASFTLIRQPPSPPPPPPEVTVAAVALEQSVNIVATTTVDVTAPEIVLLGSSEVVLQVYDIYTELGAQAIDNQDGVLPVNVLGGPVNTSSTTADRPIIVVYEAIDRAGNVARTERRVLVRDNCMLQRERRCPNTLRCSVFGSCNLNSQLESMSTTTSTESSPQASKTGADHMLRAPRQRIRLGLFQTNDALVKSSPKGFQVPVDNIPPTIQIRGTGQLYVTPAGARGMINVVLAGSAYVDAGATAADVVPVAASRSGSGTTTGSTTKTVNLTSTILTRVFSPSGLQVGTVSTDEPTGDEAAGGVPYLITYDVVDDAGNRASTVYRRVYVVCPAPEYECPREDEDSPRACSKGGMCGVTGLVSNQAASTTIATAGSLSGSIVTASSGSTSSGSTSSGSASASSSSSPGGSSGSTYQATRVPRLVLNGESVITITAGTSYLPCRGATATDCEPGSTATLDTFGDLNHQVRACATGVPNPLPYNFIGLKYCNLDTRTPGIYKISFHLVWPDVPEMVIYRTVVVQDLCEGERACSDGKCSVDGVCSNELKIEVQAAASWQPAGKTTSSATSTAPAITAITNTPPRITLSTSEIIGQQVSIFSGVAYSLCTAGQRPTQALPCEPLGIAEDVEDGNLTALAIVQGANVGPMWQLAIYDSTGANATAERLIIVISPCPADQFTCDDSMAASDSSVPAGVVCSPVPCALRQGLQGLDANAGARPRLFLLPSLQIDHLSKAELNQSLVLTYRQPAPFSLAPCAAFTDAVPATPTQQTAAGLCGAVANSSTGDDLTPYITTAVKALCPSGGSSSCYGCSVTGLSMGTCLPGRYRIVYSVKDGDAVSGLQKAARLDVSVEQLKAQTFTFSMYYNGTAARSPDRMAAEAFAATLRSANVSTKVEMLSIALKALGVATGSVRRLDLLAEPGVQPCNVSVVSYCVAVAINVTTGSADFWDTSDMFFGALYSDATASEDGTCVNVTLTELTAILASADSAVASLEPYSTTCTEKRPEGASMAQSLISGAVDGVGGASQTILSNQAALPWLIARVEDKLSETDEPPAGRSLPPPDPSVRNHKGYRRASTGSMQAAATALASETQQAQELLAKMTGKEAERGRAGTLGLTASLLQIAVNEAESAALLANITAVLLPEASAVALDADLMNAYLDPAYIACVSSKVSVASFAFHVSRYTTAAPPDPQPPAQAASPSHRRRLFRSPDEDGWARWPSPGSGQIATTARLPWLSQAYSRMSSLVCASPQGYHGHLLTSVQGVFCDTRGGNRPNADTTEGASTGQRGRMYGSRRRSTRGTSNSNSGRSQFTGYTLPDGSQYNYSLLDDSDLRRRRAGGRNDVMLGLLLHQERRTVDGLADSNRRVCKQSSYSYFYGGCDARTFKVVLSGNLGGIGNDPVFSRVSSLYDATLRSSDWYNMTEGSPEINPLGLPYGFFHEPLESFSPGYPLLLDTRLSAKRAGQALTYLRDGGYLSATLTKSLRAELVTYNPDAAVFGYWRVDFTWLDSGDIRATSYLLGLPAVSYGEYIKNLQVARFLPDFFLVLLVLAYCCMTVYDVVMQLRAQREQRNQLRGGGPQRPWRAAASASASSFRRSFTQLGKVAPCDRTIPDGDDNFEEIDGASGPRVRGHVGSNRKYTPRMSAGWVMYETAICALMVAAIAVLYTYTVRLSVREDFIARFDVYDADAFAPARYFLLRRSTSLNSSEGASSAATNTTRTAGSPDRWRMQADPRALNAAGAVLTRLDSMYNTIVLYAFFQGLVLCALEVRWLHYISFQPHLSIVFGTLVLALPDLLHFAVVLVISIVMFAATACVVLGPSVAQFHNLSSSLTIMFQYSLLRNDGGTFKKVLSSPLERPALEHMLVGVLYFVAPLFFVFTMLQFILSFLVLPFQELKRAVDGLPGVPQDVLRILHWYWERFIKAAPKNKLLLHWLEDSLAKGPSRSFLYRMRTMLSARGASMMARVRSVRLDSRRINWSMSMQGSISANGQRSAPRSPPEGPSAALTATRTTDSAAGAQNCSSIGGGSHGTGLLDLQQSFGSKLGSRPSKRALVKAVSFRSGSQQLTWQAAPLAPVAANTSAVTGDIWVNRLAAEGEARKVVIMDPPPSDLTSGGRARTLHRFFSTGFESAALSRPRPQGVPAAALRSDAMGGATARSRMRLVLLAKRLSNPRQQGDGPAAGGSSSREAGVTVVEDAAIHLADKVLANLVMRLGDGTDLSELAEAAAMTPAPLSRAASNVGREVSPSPPPSTPTSAAAQPSMLWRRPSAPVLASDLHADTPPVSVGSGCASSVHEKSRNRAGDGGADGASGPSSLNTAMDGAREGMINTVSWADCRQAALQRFMSSAQLEAPCESVAACNVVSRRSELGNNDINEMLPPSFIMTSAMMRLPTPPALPTAHGAALPLSPPSSSSRLAARSPLATTRGSFQRRASPKPQISDIACWRQPSLQADSDSTAISPNTNTGSGDGRISEGPSNPPAGGSNTDKVYSSCRDVLDALLELIRYLSWMQRQVSAATMEIEAMATFLSRLISEVEALPSSSTRDRKAVRAALHAGLQAVLAQGGGQEANSDGRVLASRRYFGAHDPQRETSRWKQASYGNQPPNWDLLRQRVAEMGSAADNGGSAVQLSHIAASACEVLQNAVTGPTGYSVVPLAYYSTRRLDRDTAARQRRGWRPRRLSLLAAEKSRVSGPGVIIPVSSKRNDIMGAEVGYNNRDSLPDSGHARMAVRPTADRGEKM
ncbi:hypothetical protein VOLCADRAFT_87436 [Volvox carteri f. nagariensis]|uniref:Polycystin cation channel PKD1/PKD2 domain-containing protein n=1 Tax=Volvox carteri f. nagariensis TaxID=3068 RepID=D8TLC2_VOLCA|nr:uncharacterized protein VOLCADRAFT_87436 [Volvox carteri f. nagariensis]EFJ51847.1 hypothetical protein VOLCADRAFT_87436 [Volvox carteri f. nagariensis]|eukprot:XP_002947257.1 hypothetical protein VOLCADRAFT_87436 [Volvox carteri f. nagariensis]